MDALVIYDSVFGNTEKVAQSIGDALSQQVKVEVIRVSAFNIQMLDGLKYLFVGSPTRAFQPTPATKTLLKNLPVGALKGIQIAAFDTRISLDDTNSGILKFMVKLFGYAAETIHKLLLKKGGSTSIPDDWFFVKESEGPLKEGELERAKDWAKQILE